MIRNKSIARRWGPRTIGCLLASLPGVLLPVGCGRQDHGGAPPLPLVSVSRPLQREVIDWDEYPGRLAATESVEVRARVSGFLEQASFQEGAIVDQGQLLFVIDARPYEAQLSQAQAQLAQAEAQLRLTRRELERIEQLRQAGAANELEFFRARQAMEEAQAAVAGGQAAVQAAQLNVQWCRVEAPIRGRVGRRLVTAGNLIAGGAGQVTTLLTTIVGVDPIYCYVNVDEQSLLRYQNGTDQRPRPGGSQSRVPTQLALINEKDFSRQGYVDFVDNRVDPSTGTIQIRGVFPNPAGELLPGLFARMRVLGEGRHTVLLLPEEAIGILQARQYVLTVAPGDVVEQTPIRLGQVYGNFRAVEGLSPQTTVIVSGLMQARPGMRVQTKEVDLTAQAAATTEPATAPTTGTGQAGAASGTGAGGPSMGGAANSPPAAGGRP